MDEKQLQAIEARWEPYLDKKAPSGSLGGDFLIVLAEVRRLQGENEGLKNLVEQCRGYYEI